MDKRIVALGLVAGFAGGVGAFAMARWNVTPSIAAAIDYEEGRSAAEAALSGAPEHSHELFSRALQENVGAGVATIGFGIVIGALFAVAYGMTWLTLRRHRLAATPRGTAVATAGAGFVAVCLLPFLAYPANPPGVGAHDTMADRTTAYLTVLLLSVGLAGVAFVMASRSAARIGGFAAAVAGVSGYATAMGVVLALAPRFSETPGPLTDDSGAVVFPGFPAEVLADFRMYSVLSQAVLWVIVGVVFAAVIPRALHVSSSRTPRANTVVV